MSIQLLALFQNNLVYINIYIYIYAQVIIWLNTMCLQAYHQSITIRRIVGLGQAPGSLAIAEFPVILQNRPDEWRVEKLLERLM